MGHVCQRVGSGRLYSFLSGFEGLVLSLPCLEGGSPTGVLTSAKTGKGCILSSV